MTYIYLLCDAANVVKGIQLAECADHTDAVSKAARTLRPGVGAIEVWHDGRRVGRVEATGGRKRLGERAGRVCEAWTCSGPDPLAPKD